MKNVAVILIITVMLLSCGNGADEPGVTTNDDTMNTVTPVTYQAVIEGSYLGILPCADCEGVETRLTLFADSTYQLVNNYLGKNPKDTAGLNVGKTGKFMMHNDTVHLVGDQSKFLRTDTALIQLDATGQLFTGEIADRFILKKVK
jgi:copper homeostasis protein (lipoprotein)